MFSQLFVYLQKKTVVELSMVNFKFFVLTGFIIIPFHFLVPDNIENTILFFQLCFLWRAPYIVKRQK